MTKIKILALIAALAAGCTPQSDVKLPEEYAQIRVVAQSQTFSSSLTVSKVEIDGSTYIIVSTGHGVAICRAPSK
jgi:hypothetical protein